MALIDTLYDTFTGSTLGALWTGSGTVSGGAVNTTGNTPILSASTYTYEGSFLIVKLLNGDDTDYVDNNQVIGVEGGAARGIGRSFFSDKWALRNFDASYANTGAVAGFGGTDPWLKIVFNAGGTDYYTSTDGTSWGSVKYADSDATGAAWANKKLRINLTKVDQIGVASASSIAAISSGYHVRNINR